MSEGPPSSWRNGILDRFSSDIAGACRLTIVADPNGLLTDKDVSNQLEANGFKVVTFEDHVEFRLTFERHFRAAWEQGLPGFSLVVRTPDLDPYLLPYDLVVLAERDLRVFRFSIADLFPILAPGPLSELDPTAVDALFQAVERSYPRPMGEDGTRDFVLRHVFDIDPNQIVAPRDLLRVLLRKHYRDERIPIGIEDRLIEFLERSGRWKDWPLARLIHNRADFVQFIEERWQIYTTNKAGGSSAHLSQGFKLPGPADLPFDDKDVRAYIDNMFVDGILSPTDVVAPDALAQTWATVGVRGVSGLDGVARLRNLLPRIETELPQDSSAYGGWLVFARRWAEVTALWGAAYDELDQSDRAEKLRLEGIVDARFGQWMLSHYSTLHSLMFLPRPVMVHHVPHYLAHRLQRGPQGRVAVIVVDGLSLDQWTVIRRMMPANIPSPEEHAAFAWVPTLTPVSRQSIFAGQAPFGFQDSINDTSFEPKLWKKFWENKGLKPSETFFAKQSAAMSEEGFIERIEEAASGPFCRAMGIVLTTVDEMIHGTILGASQIHQDVASWAKRGTLWGIVGALIARNFDVVITSDHGNIEARGIGRPDAGATAETRGERVQVFKDEALRRRIADKFPSTTEWPPVGLPSDYLALIAPPRKAFTTQGEIIVAHGGISVEEVLVPLIEFRISQ